MRKDLIKILQAELEQGSSSRVAKLLSSSPGF